MPSKNDDLIRIIIALVILALLIIGAAAVSVAGIRRIRPSRSPPYAVAQLRTSVKAHEVGVYNGYYIRD